MAYDHKSPTVSASRDARYARQYGHGTLQRFIAGCRCRKCNGHAIVNGGMAGRMTMPRAAWLAAWRTKAPTLCDVTFANDR